ncbi:DUF732 domain-containing protein [Mycetocola tolaasinivorans]|uniref:DUF732 domain-containing protein n=1 Tax=Mycetocola tolaasinivorans TaxID=76635 RepID=A0A3L7A8K0_9MICO|nr:DUF732 domain-containing protein [Mycetocola tolaasinivorans]RLP76497.1 DUF732 domain-containing protein [Mycetocola tolaasinivorans]
MKHRFGIAAIVVAVVALSGCASGPTAINNGEFSARAQALKSYSTIPTGRLIEFARDFCSRLEAGGDSEAKLREISDEYRRVSIADGRTADDADSFMSTATARYCPDLGEKLK